MAQTKLSKPQSSSDKKLYIAVIACIVLVIVSFVANILMMEYAFNKLNFENQTSFHDLEYRIREVNLRLKNDPNNEKELKFLETKNIHYKKD